MDFFGILFDIKNGKKVPYSKTYFDTLFAENLAGVTTLTGTLPLTFTTSETALRSWTIYGADIEHEKTASGKSITFYTDEDKLRDWTIYGNAEGVGERTKNLISVNSITADSGVTIVDADEATGSLKLSSSVQYRGGRFDFNFEDGKIYTISVINNIATSNARIAFRQVGTNTIVSSVSLGTAGVKTVTLTFSSTDYPNGVYVSFICNMTNDGETRTISLSNLMLVEGDKTPEFIPFGYQVPITVSQTGQTDKNYNFYIGDSPLSDGETISKSSTGVDIATADGSNTITTSLSNQPDMSITFNEFTGVGERTRNLFNKNACELVQIDTEGTMKFGTQLDVKGDAQYTLINSNPRNVDIYILVHSESINRYQSTLVRTSPVHFIMPRGYKAYLRTNDDILTDWDTIGVTDIALYEGNLTNPSFVPYGYKIPLTITSGQQSTDYDIFIGDAPLTEEQSVTDTLTINTFEGENVLDTTLTDPVSMTIKYKE